MSSLITVHGMNLSIKPNQIDISKSANAAKAGSIADSESPASPESAKPASKGETVSISSNAKAVYAQNTAAERQASMSPGELRGLYTKGQADIVRFSSLFAGSASADRSALLPQTDDPARLEMGQKAIDYAVAIHQSPQGKAPNPFSGMDRNALSGIVYDDSGTFTEAEKVSAYSELQKQDSDRFATLASKVTNGGDNREVFKGILEYFDSLPPVEKAAYPDGYRDSVKGFLDDEVTKWGAIQDTASGNSKILNSALSSNKFNDTANLSPAEKLQELVTKAQEAQKK